jgi:hypothetical protein
LVGLSEVNWFYSNSNICQESKQINEAKVLIFSKKQKTKIEQQSSIFKFLHPAQKAIATVNEVI